MAIVISEIIGTYPQADGRQYVRERHVDQLAKEYFVEYLADIGMDINAKLAEHAAQIWQNCIDGEIQMWIGKLEQGVLPDPSLINMNYAVKLDLLREFVRWACRNKALEALKGIVAINYVKSNYNTAQIAAFLGVTNTVVNAFLSRFATLEKDLKPLLDADSTKVVEL